MNKKKLILYLSGIFLLSFVLAATYQITTFDDESTSGNLVFYGNENIIKNLSLPKNVGVTSAYLNLSSDKTVFILNPSFELNTSIEPWNWTVDNSSIGNLSGYTVEVKNDWASEGSQSEFICLNFGSAKQYSGTEYAGVKQDIIIDSNYPILKLQVRHQYPISSDQTPAEIYIDDVKVWDSLPKPGSGWYIKNPEINLSDYAGENITLELRVHNSLSGGVAGGSCSGQTYFDNITFNNVDEIKINNPYLEVGDVDGDYEWSYSGEFNLTQSTGDLSSAINSYLLFCTADSIGYCTVPFLFHSDTAGILQYSNFFIEYMEPEPSIIDPLNWQVSMLPGETVYNTWTLKNVGKGELINCIPDAGDLNDYSIFSDTEFDLDANYTKDIIVTINQPAEGEYNTYFSVTCNISFNETKTTENNPYLMFVVSGESEEGGTTPLGFTGGSGTAPKKECNIKFIRPTSRIVLQGAEKQLSDKIEIIIENTGSSKDNFNFELSDTLEDKCTLKTNKATINGKSTFSNWVQCEFEQESYEGLMEVTSSVKECDSSLTIKVSSSGLGKIIAWFNALIGGEDIIIFGIAVPSIILFFGVILISLTIVGVFLLTKKFVQW